MDEITRYLESIEGKVDRVLHTAERTLNVARMILEGEKKMSREFDDLVAQVESTTSLEQSAIIMIQGIVAQLAAAGNDAVKLKALHDQLNTSAQRLKDAMMANTPGPAPTPPGPVPTPPPPSPMPGP